MQRPMLTPPRSKDLQAHRIKLVLTVGTAIPMRRTVGTLYAGDNIGSSQASTDRSAALVSPWGLDMPLRAEVTYHAFASMPI